MSKEISRRRFLAEAMATGIVGSGMLTAVSVASSQQAYAAGSSWDIETEVLVVGAGGAGLTAAVTAQRAGAQVVVIEKATVECETGYGVTRSSGGNGCVVTDEVAVLDYINAQSLGFADMEAAKVWAQYGTTIPDFLDSVGVNYVVRDDQPGADFPNFPGAESLVAVQISDPDAMLRGGGYYLRTLIPLFTDEGGEILLGTQAVELIQDENKNIVGVKALQNGAEVLIHATKGVILACGGFEGNDEMMFHYMRTYPLAGLAWPLNTGDGIKMIQRVGGDLVHMNNVCAQGYGFRYPGFVQLRTGLNGATFPGKSYIFVNKRGLRFECENPNKAGGPLGHRCYLDYNRFDVSNEQVNGGFDNNPFFAVMDSKVVDAGPIFKASPNSGIRAVDPADGGLAEEWSEDNSVEIEKGYLLKADTLEELAQKINEYCADEGYVMDGAVLAATVEQYNGYCEAGEDPDFERPASSGEDANLVALDTPPFYALRLQPSVYNTLGGPRKNGNAQILDVDGDVIPHLYAAGVFGESADQSYTMYGQNWAEILNYGRIAGEQAAAEEPVA